MRQGPISIQQNKSN